MKPYNLIATVLATVLGLMAAAASYAAPPFDPQKQPFGTLPPLVLTGFNLSGTAGTQNVFQPWFDGNSWAGDVLAYPMTPSGSADISNRLWSAAEVFTSKQGCGTATDEPTATTTWFKTGRKIVTRSSTGLNKPFQWGTIGSGHQTAIGDEATLDFIRGDRSNEKENLVVEGGYDPAAPDPALVQYACGTATGTFRARNSIMGDVVHGKSVYVAAPPADYTFDKYQEFKAAWKSRAPRVYVPANDGMVHAFDAATGEEVWAYIPSMIIPKLKDLTASPYYHRYLVDGAMTANDVKIGTAGTKLDWHTVLVGALGAGGKGLFALDVTDPTAFNETFAAAKIMWEITPSSSGFGDLGDTFSDPLIVRLNTDQWAVIVGNGYNSTTGKAVLYLIDIKTGTLIKKLDAGAGNATSPNGLSSPAAIDTNFDGKVDFVYAGDIDGKLWKFDISGATTGTWTDGSELYDAGLAIVGAPDIAAHPIKGYMVYFGTGRLFDTTDQLDATTVNYAYGIWDGAPGANNKILEQTLTEKAYNALRVRVSSGKEINWNDATDVSVKPLHYGWRTALPPGERVLSPGFVRDSRYQFTAVNNTVTNTNPPDGENWLIELDYLNGGVGPKIIFDLNANGQLNDADRIQSGGNPVAGPTGIPVAIYQGAGLLSPPVLALLNAELSTTIFNDNPYHAPNDAPSDPPTPSIDPGISGGHFDFDIYNWEESQKHIHQYDDKYNVTGASFIAPSSSDLQISKVITDPNTPFKILIANQKFSPAVVWSYAGQPYQKIIDMPEYNTAGTTVASLPQFTRNTVNTLRYNMPKDAFKVKDWSGTGDLRVGLHPTETGCVKKGTEGTVESGDGHSLHRNGALSFQFIKPGTPDSAIEMGSAAGDPGFGYKVKTSQRKDYLLAEYTVFWHHKVGCYLDGGWKKDPPEDFSSSGKSEDPEPGTLDPPWGDLGTVTNVSVTEIDDPDEDDKKYTIRITETTYSTGTKVIKEEFLKEGKVKKTVITIIPPSPGGTPTVAGTGGISQALGVSTTLTGYQQTRNSGKLGRVSWHELFTP
jgi:PilY1 beta-propeller domain